MDILIYGTVNSVVFSLIAVGFTLVYGVARVPNFAHGSIYVLVGFLTWSFVNDLKMNYALAIILALVIASIVGLLIYRLVLIRLRGMPTSEIISSFAVSLIILEGLRMQGIAGFKGFIGPFYTLKPFVEGKISIAGIFVDYQRLIIIGAGLGIVVLLWIFTHHTKIGLSLRAIAQDERAAMMLGVNSDRTAMISLSIGSALVIRQRARGQRVVQIIGGKALHPVTALPGGMSKRVTKDEQQELVRIGEEMVEFAKTTIQVFDDVVLKDPATVDLILSDTYCHRTYSIGLVDAAGKVNFYDGTVRVVDPEGKELCRYRPEQYLEHIAEAVLPYSYLKYPYLKKVGWKGLVDGVDSGVYRATPLSLLNVSEGMATPLAQAAYERLYETLTGDRAGRKPVHATLATHWARVVELIKAMQARGYDDRFSAAITAASSVIGPIFPPSVPMVIYAGVTGTSVARLFLGGAIPGILMTIFLMVATYVVAVRRNFPREPRPNLAGAVQSFREAIFAILSPVIVLGAIVTGITTATEAAVVAVLYNLLLGFCYRTLRLADLPRLFIETGVETGVMMLIVSAVGVFSWILTYLLVPQAMMDFIFAYTKSQALVIALLIVLLLILGCFMNPTPGLVISVPFILPLSEEIGIDLVHLGVLMVLVLAIGLPTPPVGLCLFIVARIARLDVSVVFRECTPYIVALVAVSVSARRPKMPGTRVFVSWQGTSSGATKGRSRSR